MKKFLLILLTCIQLTSLFISSILFFILKISFITKIYENFYTNHNLAPKLGITQDQLMFYTHNLLAYLSNENISLDSSWYSEKDILHMIDVKNLFISGENILYICIIVFIISSFLLLITKSFRFSILLFNKVFFSFITTLILLLVYVVIDFNNFWINFHLLLFKNDLWLLDPAESNLIKMFPEEFFFSIVSIIAVSIIIYFLIFFFLIKYIKKIIRNNNFGN